MKYDIISGKNVYEARTIVHQLLIVSLVGPWARGPRPFLVSKVPGPGPGHIYKDPGPVPGYHAPVGWNYLSSYLDIQILGMILFCILNFIKHIP